MKLIDVLVRELPKLGGWPDGVTKISQDYDGEIWCWRGNDYGTVKSYCRIREIADNHRKQGKDETRDCFVTREQYEAALTASNPEWDGVGLPPVGCECEGKQLAQINWNKFKVVAIESGHVFGFWNDNVSTGLDSRLWEFRPIRSEADKRRDEAVTALHDEYFSHAPIDKVRDVLYALYDAIAAGKIPHIRID